MNSTLKIPDANCQVKGCNRPPSGRYYDGKNYCRIHYKEMLFGDFKTAHDSWQPENEPSERLRRLLGRIYEEFCKPPDESYLSKARIRNRAFGFVKTKNGIEFSITRHPGAWTHGDIKPVVQTWDVELATWTFKLVSDRPWKKGDPS